MLSYFDKSDKYWRSRIIGYRRIFAPVRRRAAPAKMSRRPPCVSANAERARGPRRKRYLDCEIKPGNEPSSPAIPNDDDLFNVDVSRHAVFLQVKDVAFDLGRFTADRNPLATDLDFFAQAVFKKIPHSHYSSVNLGFNEAQILPHRFADAKLAGALRIDARYRQALMWQRRSTQWLFIFGAWTLPGLYFAIQVYLQHACEARPITLTQALLRGIVFWLLWVVSSPLILWLARTFPIPRREWLDGLLFPCARRIHLLVRPPAPLRGDFVAAEQGVWPHSISAMLAEFQPVFLSSFAWWSLIYWTILLASYAFDYYHRYQEGQLRASKLETELAQSQLAALKMQLHPHFLFNTLHSISALMREDVEAADQMIARLGEFLRMTLRNSGEQETTLEQELNFWNATWRSRGCVFKTALRRG